MSPSTAINVRRVDSPSLLRSMATRRPSTSEAFLEVNGVGEKKCRQYGEIVLDTIKKYCLANTVDMDVLRG